LQKSNFQFANRKKETNKGKKEKREKMKDGKYMRGD
jgi:hypothetical protein